jgi:hypothetical protein
MRLKGRVQVMFVGTDKTVLPFFSRNNDVGQASLTLESVEADPAVI